MQGTAARGQELRLTGEAALAADFISVRLTVASFLASEPSVAVANLTRSSSPVPVVEAVGGSSVATSALRPLSLRLRVRPSECVSASVLQPPVDWNLVSVAPTTGTSMSTLNTTAAAANLRSRLAGFAKERGRELAIPTGTLRAGMTYTLLATVQHALVTSTGTQVQASSTVTYTLRTVPQGVQALLDGGFRRTASHLTTF